jgi:predicted ATPase
MAESKPQARITRVRLENYKSIKFCDVQLEPITVLVGQNGSGKSNFLDALSFVADALQNSFDYAISTRGGGNKIVFKNSSVEFPTDFSITLSVHTENIDFDYAIKIRFQMSNDGRSYLDGDIYSESCKILNGDYFVVENGNLLESSISKPPIASKENLYLTRVSGVLEFMDAYTFLSGISIYNPIPELIRSGVGKDLTTRKISRNAENLSSVVYQNIKREQDPTQKVHDYLSKLLQGYKGLNITIGENLDVGITQNHINSQVFWSKSLSDGTLRFLAILFILLIKPDFLAEKSFIGIEEPEVFLHPAAAGLLIDAMREASLDSQIIFSTHSPDLLDGIDLNTERVLAVNISGGETIIAPIDSASREIVRRNLYTLGDLLRMNQLEPEQNSKLEGSV